MATAPQYESYYCSDPNCLYCKDLRQATEQLTVEHDLIAEKSETQIRNRQ